MNLSVFSDISRILSESQYVNLIFRGLISTILLSILGTILGLFLGIFLAFGKKIDISKKDPWFMKMWKYPLKYLCIIYSVVVRGTPMMVQAMIFQYALITIGINFSMMLTNNNVFNGWFFGGLIIITFNTAAYMGEIIQSGLNGVSNDQREGAKSLGMTPLQSLFKVELPQALRNAIPTIGNEWIVNIKDSSVLNVVGVSELFFFAKTIAGSTYLILASYVIIAIIYLILTLLTTLILKIVERKLDGKNFEFKLFYFHKRGEVNNEN
jgi:putative lysine transport system permease protein